MENYLLMTAAVILLCLSLNKVMSKLGIPMLLAFIVLGMLFGIDGILKISFDDCYAAQQICTIALIFIMFYGGFGTNIKRAKPVMAQAVLLSTVGVIITAAAVGVFCHFILRFDFMESMLTIVILSMMQGEFSGVLLLKNLFLQIFLGVLVGTVIAFASAWLLKRIEFNTNGFDTIFVFAISLVSYALASMVGGNGYLSTYIAGIILGNVQLNNKKSMIHFLME